ncbi:alpha/beta fold hydrolase [Bacillus sp. B-jedd]|uniref:alpha/beta fold hydrolase n=1 Tax=Bacillus sp. B-jedd TaxID=1476857 RepID=UPI0005156EF1|nr:alpha/beta fold hydrolase [Bacillus sp. B-jedd]CEG28708.1 peptidase [Bacillus sp. B-jedd]
MIAEINGCKIYYEVHGNENGHPIFFIHGGPGLGDCRADVATFAPLGEHFRLVFIDMRGSGRSEEKPPYTHEQWTDDIDQLRQLLGFDKITIHGSSYGGFISLEYALKYQCHLEHAFLNVTSANNDHHYAAIENAMNSNLPGIDRDMLDRLFNGRVSSNEEFKEMYTAILPLYAAVEFDPVAAQKKLDSIHYHYATHNAAFSENLPAYDVRSRLGEIQVPVMVTGGRLDWIVPADNAEEIAAGISKSKLVIFEKNGHSLVREESAKYIALVREFINEHTGRKEELHNV